MVETVLAVLILTSVFLCLFKLSHLLTGKILVQHAAMRVARARTVGLNDFMCRKTANVAVVPVAGKRLWPEGNELDHSMELARIPIYLGTPDGAVARGVLEYDGWNRLSLSPGDGTDTRIELGFDLFDGDWRFELNGAAGLEDNHTLYLNGQGR